MGNDEIGSRIMIAKRIQNATHNLGAPKDWNEEKNGRCNQLWIRVENGRSLSAWEPTPEELKILNEGGSVILHIVGWQVPVALTVEKN